jgi:hypothetical protein
MTVVDLAELKKNVCTMWALGDYAAIARDMFWEVGARIVARVDVAPGTSARRGLRCGQRGEPGR